MRGTVYTEKTREEVISDYEECSGEIIAIGERYDPMYGERWVYITDGDIAQLRKGKMLYNTDGEYAYCLVYKEGE